MNEASSDGFLPLARLALGSGYVGKERERWARPLAQLLEAASRGVGHLPLSQCPIEKDAPDEFFAVVAGNVLLARNAHFWGEVRQRVESLHRREFARLPDEQVARSLDAILPRTRDRTENGHIVFDNSDQRRAVATLVDAPIGVLTGGPGTGKTTCVAVMLAVRKRIEPELGPDQVLLCAPTGKAACRLGDSIKTATARLRLQPAERELLRAIEPQTLHRALHWGPVPPEQGGPFGRNGSRPLLHRIVIVDEASMVDLFLMTHLLRALGPEASLLLLGDADQLESVETGGILAELVERGVSSSPTREQKEHLEARLNTPSTSSEHANPGARSVAALPLALPGLVVKLRHSYRAKDSPWILELAAIAKPGVRSTVRQFIDCCQKHEPNLRLHRSRRTLLGVCRTHWRRWREQSRDWYLPYQPDSNSVSARLREFQLLCGDNAQVQRANQVGLAELWGVGSHSERFGLPHGCPVLVTQNRLALGLANGDMGIAIGPAPNRAAQVVVFPGRAEPVPVAQLPPHQAAFAITIHKSQGSEWQRVAIDLPSDSEVLDRNLLYTAISRSSGTLDIYADSERALNAILNDAAATIENASPHFPPVGTQLRLFDLPESGSKRPTR